MTFEKPVHTIVLDAGPIIKGDPSVSSLLAQSEQIVTLPSVISEIRDEATRSRLQTTLLPFLVLKSPKESSVKVISDFARRTGDLPVLSRVDIQLLALAYDVECERNGGDWRLRKTPGEKRINGPNPNAKPAVDVAPAAADGQFPESRLDGNGKDFEEPEIPEPQGSATGESSHAQESGTTSIDATTEAVDDAPRSPLPSEDIPSVDSTQAQPAEAETLTSQEAQGLPASIEVLQLSDVSPDDSPSDSDSEGWITPSNLKKKQEEDSTGNTAAAPEPKVLQAALLTSDYAMQNVALQMNLNLLSPSLARVRQLKTFVLRCHACFNVVKDTSKQFCPRCGKPTLNRVSCSTSANGEFKLHLKKNMQWNNRGNVFSVPKPVAGASNGRIKGGGKNGWGNDLILAEDQKEYVRAMEKEKRVKARDLMDEDYLPGLLTGSRIGGGGRVKVGAGRNVNSRKRK